MTPLFAFVHFSRKYPYVNAKIIILRKIFQLTTYCRHVVLYLRGIDYCIQQFSIKKRSKK